MSNSARKAEEMYRLVNELESGGYDRQSFARLHGIGVAKLDYWRARYRRKNGKGSGFIQLSCKPDSVSLEILYPNGVCVRVNGDPGQVRLHELVTLL